MFRRNVQLISKYSIPVSPMRTIGTTATAAYGLNREISNDCKYYVKNVDIETCGDLYMKWKSRKSLYKNAPCEGLKLNVEYADTGYTNSPLVLCLHGAPGNHADFGLLMNHLSKKNVRVIAPNFPDYSLTEKTNFFRHTSDEKCEYLKDFLSAINIKKIDMLVTHSSAVYPGLNLWQDNDALNIKSLALINPSGHRRVKAMKPKWFIDNSVQMYSNPIGRWFYRKLGKTILRIKGVPVEVNNLDNVFLTATTICNTNVEKLGQYLNTIAERQIPTLYVFSENDKLIESAVYYEMASILGVSKEEFNVLDKHENSIKKCILSCIQLSAIKLSLLAQPQNNVTTLCFQSGGHYAFLKHAAIVNQSIDDLLHSTSGYKVNTGDIQKSKSFVGHTNVVETRLRSKQTNS